LAGIFSSGVAAGFFGGTGTATVGAAAAFVCAKPLPAVAAAQASDKANAATIRWVMLLPI